jgi:SP family facilitated glucose transporter-like MFS transporter 1
VSDWLTTYLNAGPHILFLHHQAQFGWMVYISVLAIIIYVVCFAVGLGRFVDWAFFVSKCSCRTGPIPMMIASELFRQGPRPSAMSVAGAVNWVCTFIIAMSFELIQVGTIIVSFLLA